MNKTISRSIAVIEVSAVAFGLIPVIARSVYNVFPALEGWQNDTGFNVPIVFYALSIAVPLLLAIVRQKRPIIYGVDLSNGKYHLGIAMSCFTPVALASLLYLLVDVTSWGGAFILITGQIVLLLFLTRVLRNYPTFKPILLMGAVLPILPGLAQASLSALGKSLVLFLNYGLFVGFGEEILYRGYIESRLNEAFGRPLNFSGVSFGWGLLITNLLFGLMHVGVQRWILGINHDVTLAWGTWTIFSGLVFSFVREKTGSILAPALLHGLPQAFAQVAILFMR